ncbi:MAG TPA: bifunctional UDP-3-O-[3-hydroxymyristoyl] N-acetylglucosamine deacetylase/3-hydroxyacyl-ACP dehydratase [Candidatus Paceibacterota bacterium]|nr:bifunctional UDP-3-O-[3-hydroxymyristoyl] N-acetylglucosamine deacetylase/3-hydroxyacyl-ACP dehydratase [Verrucomicrobiota bacterium]HOX04153.1 bifunctional UDP-3-O-[3-hydroxymyristoyl] N-acetylglucosamine deacetylase/3-hydroxyacyl-ACP dehydratase [Verrucomicrobiota bacterium]HRZ47054.1 bifunctional UDP-3-O-[3-hydroxymyristoyl] N-acetylglucosamine deacetylase/3-hydroxyacyl-ACP dehydratase [Candidatus Paceibacterota bacterium]HRZ94444.1 bifunctional UDP-3-O-[3-hydroxymyristoyl] N-acetylglucosa
MLNQQTLREAASYSGVGLHSGSRVEMTLHPAPADTGIRFRRTDLDGQPEIEALVEHVGDTQRSTTLAKGNIRIHTVEHVLSALAGMGVDNATIELNANEPPIGDGSAREFARLIRSAGIQPQPQPREAFRVASPFEVQAGETAISVFPHDRLKLTCVSSDRGGRFTQVYSLEVTPDSWERELAHARTFCFYEEIEHLIKNGLIRGGSLENAVVIREDAVLTNEPLRYPEEFVRHKMLDLVGDLSLLGCPLQAHVMAIRPGHAANCELVRQLSSLRRKPMLTAQTFVPPPAPRAAPAESIKAGSVLQEGIELHAAQLLKVVPHRFPFLMIDRVKRIEGNRITAIKSVSINEPYFEGHFPRLPIMPGVLQLEAIAQTAGILLLRQAENMGKYAYFMSAESVKWRKPVVPGDTLVIEVELTRIRGKIGKAKGVCRVENDIVSEAEVTFMLGEG